MSSRPPMELRFRFGCPLALAVTAAGVAAVDRLVYIREFWAEDWLFLGALIGVPFGVLALAKVRDWLAWLLALGLTAAVWSYFAYSDPRSTDFVFGIGMMLAPFIIAGVCLAVAGMRGRIAWAHEGPSADDSGRPNP